MSVRELAARRNAVSHQLALHSIRDVLREQSRRDPMKGFDTLESMTRGNLDMLRPKMEAARKFLESAAKRKEAGALDDSTFGAETAGAATALALFESLVALLEVARKADSNYPLKCVHYASGVLVAKMEGNVLRENRYPEGADALKRALARSRVALARDIHEDVVQALDGVPAQFSVKLPGPPAQL
ncbi:MAG: hypothetical protein AB1529_01900 [Candidatus Micrarchaeota archaeon]